MGELKELFNVGVNRATGLTALGVHAIVLAIDHPLELLVSGGAVDGLCQVAFEQCESTADLAILILQAMANHAGDAFARDGMPVHVAHEDRLSQIHADLGMAANAALVREPSRSQNLPKSAIGPGAS